jgi:hypothetical protein
MTAPPPFQRDAERHVTGSTTIRVTKATRRLLEQLRSQVMAAIDLDELIYELAWSRLADLDVAPSPSFHDTDAGRARPDLAEALDKALTGIPPSPTTGDPPPPARLTPPAVRSAPDGAAGAGATNPDNPPPRGRAVPGERERPG